MAYNYEWAKKAYQSMTREQQQQFVENNKNDANFQRFVKEYTAEMSGKSTPTSMPTVSSSSAKTDTTTTPKVSTASSAKTYTAVPEYQWTWSNKTNTYQNQWAGNYSYDTWTQYYEKQWTPVNTNYSSTRNAWDALSYEQQQEKLNQNPNLREWIIRIWWTIKEWPTWAKTSPYQNQWEWQYVYNPKTWYYEKKGGTQWATKWWDYQDNSQARMDEIANNLNNYRITNPNLFDNWGSFYNFFIAWKWRTPEQEKFLTDYYNNMKRYNEYDNLSSDEVGWMIARWEIPDDYLNYLKNSDPQRWAEIQWARKDVEDQIMNETYLNTAASQAWFDMWDSDWWKWNKTEMWYRDVNNDWLDDRLYHEPTEEELKLVEENNQYEQERAKLTDAMKWLQEDLTNQYPDADLSTIMILTSDRWNKIQRALDTLAVNQTKVQWSLKYLQNERATMDDAWQNTINELQKQYWMYYDYSPEWISKLAQAKYAATNITLDQADSGNETQKQMALEAAITPIFDKYWDIIERSPAEVINDTIAYAKKNWVWLRQALEENFMKPLREKPAYQSMQSQMDATWLKREKVGKDANWNDIYWFVDLANKTVSPYWAIWGWVSSSTANTYTVEEVSSNRDKRVSAMRDIANQYDNLWDMAEWIAYNMEWVGWWNLECWQYVNDYINAVTWSKWQYGNLVSQKASLAPNKDWDSIQVWDVVVFDYNKNTPQWVLNSPQKEDLLKYWHVGFVTWINPDGSINMSHTNWWVVQNTVVKPWSSFYNSFAGSQHINKSQSLWKWFNEQLTNEYLAFIQAAWKPADQKKIAEWLWMSVDELREQSNKYSWQQTADTYFDMLGRINNILSLAESWDLPSFATRKNAQSEWFFWGLTTRNQSVSDWKADNDKIVDTLSLDSLINLKWRWATFWALSDSEREAIGRYATALWSPMSDAKYINELKQLRAKLIESSHWYLWDMSSYWQNQSYDWTAWI